MSGHEDVPEWLDTVLVQKALDAEGAKVIVRAVTVEGHANNVGQHYMSHIYRIRAFVSSCQSDAHEEECERLREVSLIVKTLPSSSVARATVEGGGFFRVERQALSQVLPSLHAMVADIEAAAEALEELTEEEHGFPRETSTGEKYREPLWAPCLLSGDNPEEFIMMKDITAEGYCAVDAARGLGLCHFLVALRALARFHALSRLKLEGTESDKEPLLSLNITDSDALEEFRACIEGELVVAGREIAQWPDFPSHYGERISAFAPVALQRFLDANEMKPNAFNVLLHGDFWANNLLFRYDASGHPCEVRAVDWQITHVGLPAVDLLYFMYTSLSENVWEKHWDLLLREYHVELTNSLKALGCVRKPSLSELQTQMGSDQSGAWAVFACIHILPLVKNPRCEYEPGRKPEEQSHIYRSLPYQRAMRRALPRLLKDGLLQI